MKQELQFIVKSGLADNKWGVIYGGDLIHYDDNHFFETKNQIGAEILKLKLEKMLIEHRLTFLYDKFK